MRRTPRRAVVLAAGFGTRMLPLTRQVPKALLPLWGRPALGHTLDLLRSWGVRDVLINTHHLPDDILHFVLRHEREGLGLHLSFEPEILGTGGALRRAEWFLREDPFWLINVDIAAELDPDPLLRAYARHRPLAALWMHPEKGPRTVEVRRGFVAGFESARPGSKGTHTFCGLHLVSPRVLRFLPESGFAGIIPAYQRAMRRGERIAAACVPGSYWADLGTPEQYLAAHREVLEHYRHRQPGRRLFDPALHRAARGTGAVISGFAAIDPSAIVARGARVEDAVILGGARLDRSARVRRAVVAPGTRVRGKAVYVAMRADRALEEDAIRFLSRRGWRAGSAVAQPLGPRGSDRSFTRITPAPGGGTALLMRYDPARRENTLYCRHARFLARLGLRVPGIRLDDPERHLALIEDLPGVSLEEAVRADPRAAPRLYRKVLDAVARLHTRGAAAARRRRLPLMPGFTAKLYRWEHELFAREMLSGRLGLAAPQAAPVLRELSAVARELLRAPRVLVHRDLQSSNILVAKGAPAFLDFQGMRLGPAAYDLASLLCDPYVALPEALQCELLAYYAERAAAPSVDRWFWPAAVQRLAQALGAYARLSRRPGLQRFADHIAPAAAMMLRALSHLPGRPALRAVALRLARGRTADRH